MAGSPKTSAVIEMLSALESAARFAMERDDVSRQDRFGYEADVRLRPLHEKLVSLGWAVEAHTRGSIYYSRGKHRLRLSNHEVPFTAEREYAASNGGWTWHRHGWQIITARTTLSDCLAEIDEIEEEIAE